MSDYAKGLEGVIANESALSNVEGLDGRLSYLGYSIDELVENCSFEETTYLLHFGKLPNTSELADFEKSLRTNREIPQGVIDFLKSAPKDANPMDVLRTGVSMLGLFDKRAGIGEPDQDANREVAISLCAQTSVIVAYYHRARQGLDLPPVRDDLSEAGHFLYLITGEEPSEAATKTLDIAYILHADHGMNASTFSARVTVATLSDFYSAMTSAVGTLKGPLHGGANEGVIKMLQEIGSLDKVDAYVEDCLENKKKIMGIGHRVYKVLDPRAPHLQRMAIKLTEELGETKWIDMSERIATMMRERKGLNAKRRFFILRPSTTLSIFRPISSHQSLRFHAWPVGLHRFLNSSRITVSTARSPSMSGRVSFRKSFRSKNAKNDLLDSKNHNSGVLIRS